MAAPPRQGRGKITQQTKRSWLRDKPQSSLRAREVPAAEGETKVQVVVTGKARLF